MIHKVSLIFGYDYYTGTITVSPQAMFTFLRRPFKDWLYTKTWDDYQIDNWTDNKFRIYVFESTRHYDDEDFFFDPKDAEWLGFRVDLEQADAEAEFVFTMQSVNGEIRPDVDKISKNLTDKLITAKSCINDVLSSIVRNDLKKPNR
jgi:hypothetical protein